MASLRKISLTALGSGGAAFNNSNCSTTSYVESHYGRITRTGNARKRRRQYEAVIFY